MALVKRTDNRGHKWNVYRKKVVDHATAVLTKCTRYCIIRSKRQNKSPFHRHSSQHHYLLENIVLRTPTAAQRQSIIPAKAAGAELS